MYCVRISESGVFKDAQCNYEIRSSPILLFIYLILGYGSTNTEIIAKKVKGERAEMFLILLWEASEMPWS